MINEEHVSVIIPALDEELAIGKVVSDLKALRNSEGLALIDDIIVCDNGSVDATPFVAQKAGARVVYEPEKGYGAACLKGIAALGPTDIVLFVDGDDSCAPLQANSLIKAVARPQQGLANPIQMAIGSRTAGRIEPGALTPPQRFGNYLAAVLINLLWRYQVSDLGPYRAIRYNALKRLNMQDRKFGWTIEMQIKAIQLDIDTVEVAVDSHRRIGVSKISGTLRGVIGAAHGILCTLFKLRWQQSRLMLEAKAASAIEEGHPVSKNIARQNT